MTHLSGLLPEGLRQEIYGLWEVSCYCSPRIINELLSSLYFHEVDTFPLQEYENQSSAEAKLVKQFDLLEMILQAHEYEELEKKPGGLQEFFDSTNGNVVYISHITTRT